MSGMQYCKKRSCNAINDSTSSNGLLYHDHNHQDDVWQIFSKLKFLSDKGDNKKKFPPTAPCLQTRQRVADEMKWPTATLVAQSIASASLI